MTLIIAVLLIGRLVGGKGAKGFGNGAFGKSGMLGEALRQRIKI